VGSGDLAEDGAGDDSVGIMVLVGSNVVLNVGVNVSGCGIASVGAVVTSVGASVPMGAADGVGPDVASGGVANGVGTGGVNGVSTGGDNGVGTAPGVAVGAAVVALGVAVALGASVTLGTAVMFKSGVGAGVTCKKRRRLLLLPSESFSKPAICGSCAANETTAKVAK
jgi:hypothetical protein